MWLSLLVGAVGVTSSACIASPTAVRTGRSGGSSAWIVRDGVRLTVSVPKRPYANNSLVEATLRLRNLTNQTVNLDGCMAGSWQAQAVKREGQDDFVVYPALLQTGGGSWSVCPFGRPRPKLHLRSGRTTTRTVYIVLRTRMVRGIAILWEGSNSKPIVLTTPLIHLRTRAASGPRIEMRFAGKVGATVKRVESGSVLLSEFVGCGRAGVANVSAWASRWSIAKGAVIRPMAGRGCGRLTEWYLFAGQVGRPIAQAYFCTKGPMCSYGQQAGSFFCQGGTRCLWSQVNAKAEAVAMCKEDTARFVRQLIGYKHVSEMSSYLVGFSLNMPGGLFPVERKRALQLHAQCGLATRRR